MKKLILLLSVFLIAFSFSYVYAGEKNESSKKSEKEETTDKFFKNIVDSIEKTTEDSVNKIARDIKEIKKDKK